MNNNILILNGDNKSNAKKINILEYTGNEMNNLAYEKALAHDKRNFNQFYILLLKTKLLLIFSFYCYNKDYNSQIIKMFLFFFFFSVHFTINTLFFNDETLHKIYIDEGKFNFIYQIPQTIQSSIISGIISTIINNFALSEKIILEIKEVKKLKI